MTESNHHDLGVVGRILSRGRWVEVHAVNALRLVLALIVLGVLVAQAYVFPSIAADLAAVYPEAAFLRVPLLVMVIAGLAMVQVAVVCVARLLTVVAESAGFGAGAYRYVDGIILAAATSTALAVAALVLQCATGMLQPGLLLSTTGAIVVGVGITLVAVVLRTLLVRAVELTDRAGGCVVMKPGPGSDGDRVAR